MHYFQARFKLSKTIQMPSIINSMAYTFLCLFGGLAALSGCADSQAPTLPIKAGIEWANPFIGSDGKGKTYPGATTPFGMVQLSPDNGRGGWDWISGYFYPDTTIASFSHTHLSGTGIGELYDISFFPATAPFKRTELDGDSTTLELYSRFSHEQEAASPGYYRVLLQDYGIEVELTATPRTGLQRYTRHGEGKLYVFLNLGYSRNWDATSGADIRFIDSSTIAGHRFSSGWAKDQRVFFYTRFSRPYESVEMLKENPPYVQFTFDLEPESALLVKTGLSSVSTDNAAENLLTEQPHWDFEQVREAAAESWSKQLRKIEAYSRDTAIMSIFHTALYQSMLAPTLFSDINGQYKGADSLGATRTASGYQRYTTFSLWDTFRAEHPLFTILHPGRTEDMVQSMLAHYQEYGLLPVWDLMGNETDMMIGYHAVPVIVDAYQKGLRGFDAELAFEAMKKSALQDQFGLKAYREHGYIPAETFPESVSLTLEYAYDDWCIAQMAKALGKEADYELFLQRAASYRPNFDPSTKFMRGRSADGQWQSPFSFIAYNSGAFIEANAWQYTWFVPHDVAGLITLMGGDAAFADKLDSLFLVEQQGEQLPEWISGYIGQYVHGNEPGHHIPYLYNYAGQPWKGQALLRRIMDSLYLNRPDGICGNEDCGQMSAWYLFSAMGFYPVNPAEGIYVIGSPILEEATIKLENNKQFHILAHNNSSKNIYIQSARLNGQVLDRSYIYHREIMEGGKLEFEMGPRPNQSLWVAPASRPPSMSTR